MFYLIKQNFMRLDQVLAFEKHCSVFAYGYLTVDIEKQ